LNNVTIGALGSVLPEIILTIGGLLIILFDTFLGKEEEEGKGFMALSIVFLAFAIVGGALQFGMQAVSVEPPPMPALLMVDRFGVFMKVVIAAAMLLVALAGGNYMNKQVAGRGEFWSLFLFVTVAMSLAVSASNLLLIFLGIEFLSITSYLLVGFLRDHRRSTEAGVKYFLYGSVASAVMLYGFSFLYGATGSLNLTEISAVLAESEGVWPVVAPAIVLIMVGLGFKTSLVPFHQWTPDVYEGAATPITAYLSTASKAAAFAVMVRVLIVGLGDFDTIWVPILTGLSILSMTVGNLMALNQNNVKRMLAYSSIAQAGYMLMGLIGVVASDQADVSLLGMNGLNGLMIYIFAYVFTNIGAFLVVMAVEETSGNADISSFNNLGQRSPWMAWSMFVFLLSLTGIPLTGGFIGKFFVFGAALQHQYYLLVIVAGINAGIAAYYYLNVVRAMFFPTAAAPSAVGEVKVSGGAAVAESHAPALNSSLSVQFVVAICLIATIIIGVYPPNLIGWVNAASQQLLSLSF
jgi:NADH-quinone oxidoreductase subunit N